MFVAYTPKAIKNLMKNDIFVSNSALWDELESLMRKCIPQIKTIKNENLWDFSAKSFCKIVLSKKKWNISGQFWFPVSLPMSENVILENN